MLTLRKLVSRTKKKVLKRLESLKGHSYFISDNPDLIPTRTLMQTEGVTTLEEWFTWADEWAILLRIYGDVNGKSQILEIGCGLGRIAFPLRYLLTTGTYHGFEICRFKIDFLQKEFTKAFPKFHFKWVDIHNTYYNPQGTLQAQTFQFPYADNQFDLVFAASVFTHMLPPIAENYFRETARVLKPKGRAVFSFFLLDNYNPDVERPFGFARPAFNFDFEYQAYEDTFKISNPANAEEMTAYKKTLINQYAEAAGLEWVQEPLPGQWSGRHQNWVGAQDMVVLRKK